MTAGQNVSGRTLNLARRAPSNGLTLQKHPALYAFATVPSRWCLICQTFSPLLHKSSTLPGSNIFKQILLFSDEFSNAGEEVALLSRVIVQPLQVELISIK